MLKNKKYSVQAKWQGLMPYTKSLEEQATFKQKAHGKTRAFFMGFECLTCITLGLRGKVKEDLVHKEEVYQTKGISLISIKRGGQATLHAPGQLVIYPVMDLRNWHLKPRDFLKLLESITQDTLLAYGVPTSPLEESAGLFTDRGKIAFFGVHISEGVSQHGLSLNVSNDLSLFRLIRSCGKLEREHDSLQQRNLTHSVQDVFFLWCQKATEFLYSKVQT